MSRRTVLWATALAVVMFLIPPAQSQVLSNLLSPILQTWIRTQVQQVDELRVGVAGSDAELGAGRIPSITISGRNIVYQGIQARSLQLRGNDVRLDWQGSLTGSGLRLARPVRAELALSLSEQDVNNYLASSDFQRQVRDLKVVLPASFGGDGRTEIPLELSNPRVRLLQSRIEASARVRLADGEAQDLRLASGIAPAGNRQLRLVDPRIVSTNGDSAPLEMLANLPIQLGPEVELRQVNLLPGVLFLEGSYLIQATPAVTTAQ